MLSSSEVPEIEKQRNISDLHLVSQAPMLNLMLDLREESLNKLEEKDEAEDSGYKNNNT